MMRVPWCRPRWRERATVRRNTALYHIVRCRLLYIFLESELSSGFTSRRRPLPSMRDIWYYLVASTNCRAPVATYISKKASVFWSALQALQAIQCHSLAPYIQPIRSTSPKLWRATKLCTIISGVLQSSFICAIYDFIVAYFAIYSCTQFGYVPYIFFYSLDMSPTQLSIISIYLLHDSL